MDDYPLHKACEDGNYEVLNGILQDESIDINSLNGAGETLLHIAATNGHDEITGLLLKKGADSGLSDRYKRTPLICACINGHTYVIDKLLLHGNTPHIHRALMEAIDRGRQDIALMIINSRNIHTALMYTTNKDTTPMRQLIKKMPEVAEQAFGIVCMDLPERESKFDKDHEDFEVTFHYEYLDDFKEVDNESCWNPKTFDKTNNCLYILANSESSRVLLKHPVITTLLYYKWGWLGKAFFALNTFIQTLLAILLTIFSIITLQPESATCVATRDSDNSTSCFKQYLFDGRSVSVFVFAILIIVVSLLKLGFEIFQAVKQKLTYFRDWVNYMEIFLYICSILFAFVFANDCLCPMSWQWQIGALCVFMAWINVILIVRMVPVIGVYVMMFQEIVKNFLKVAVLAFFLVLSFAFPFYMLFHDPINKEEMIRTPFRDPFTSIIKTFTMTTGELDYNTLFRQEYSESPGLQYSVVSYLLWIVFIALMPILLNNLLTGLAVDDVNAIREKAKLKTLTLWVEFILLYDQMLPVDLRSKFRKEMHDMEKTYKRGEFPSRFSNWFWYSALELSFFETDNNRIIPPDPMKEIQKQIHESEAKLEKKINLLDGKLDKILNKLAIPTGADDVCDNSVCMC